MLHEMQTGDNVPLFVAPVSATRDSTGCRKGQELKKYNFLSSWFYRSMVLK
jgi:hypothetical protein